MLDLYNWEANPTRISARGAVCPPAEWCDWKTESVISKAHLLHCPNDEPRLPISSGLCSSLSLSPLSVGRNDPHFLCVGRNGSPYAGWNALHSLGE
jgi:hypothetical protein